MFLPEAALDRDRPAADEDRQIEISTGLTFKEPLERENASAEAIAVTTASTRLAVAGEGSAALETAAFELLRSPPPPAAPAAAVTAPAGAGSPIVYDFERGKVIAGDVGTAHSPPTRADRQFDLARTEALAQAVIAQQFKSKRFVADGEHRDEVEALLGVVAGGAHAAVLDASLAPVSAFDASVVPVRRMHRGIAERLLLDPDGGPARELARADLPDAERRALELLLARTGLDRRRAILRVFCGANLMLEARNRITTGNLQQVVDKPPLSSEQLMHPERYLDEDDPPIEIKVGRRDGMVGTGYSVVATGVAGEFGLYNALEGALPPCEAASAAEGWGGDVLTVYRRRENGATAFAWHLVFDDIFEANGARNALLRAIELRYGGTFAEGLDGIYALEGGREPCVVKQVKTALGILEGGDPARLRDSLAEMMLEVVGDPDTETRAAKHDLLYRCVRAVASPFFFNQPARFDEQLHALYGIAYHHRVFRSGGEGEALNLRWIPLLDRVLDDGARGLLFTCERSPFRRDLTFFQQIVRWFESEPRGATRFWSPFFSFSSGSYDSIGVGYGMLFEQGDGAGREVLSPTPVFSSESTLHGQDVHTGVLFDAVGFGHRDGFGSRFELLPYGALLRMRMRDEPAGFDFAMLFDSILVRRVRVLPEDRHFDFAVGWGYLMRWMSDAAADERDVSLAWGLLAGHAHSPRGNGTGLLRIGRRHLLGFGSVDGRGFADLLFLRIGG